MELCSGASSLTTASLSPPQVVKSRDGFVKTRDAFLYCNGEWAVLGNVHIQMINRFSSMVSNYISQIISRDVYEIKPHIAKLLENSRQTKCWEQEMMKLLVSSQRQRNWKDEMTLFCGLLSVGEVTRDAKDLLIENYHDLVQETIIWWHL